MLDIKLVRTDPERVKENMRKKFQEEKLHLVDEVLELDAAFRASKARGDELRQQRNVISKEIGKLMGQGKKDEAEQTKQKVQAIAGELAEMEQKEAEMTEEIRKRMLVIPNLIDDSVPIGKDDSENVELEKFGDPVVPDYEIPYHTDIMEKLPTALSPPQLSPMQLLLTPQSLPISSSASSTKSIRLTFSSLSTLQTSATASSTLLK